ncbi:MAG: stage II sporulation protein M [Chromatiales bacterium]|nr:stage II sporulation protein M [Chromatiales bacterium]
MNQEAFVTRYQPLWDELEAVLDDMELPTLRRRERHSSSPRLPHLYRRLCNHYALARRRRYSPTLVEQLHRLVLRGHQQLYTHRGAWLWQLLIFIIADFPRTLRENLRYFLLALALFLLPALIIGGLCYSNEYFVYSVLDESTVVGMEEMYEPGNEKVGREKGRSAETDFMMFGHYISNNIGIGFRTFALGILAGIGTVFILVFNGVVIGGVAGHLTRVGYTDTFWPFVSGHASLELTAIVISGAAGLIVGHALLTPGQYRRLDALKIRGRVALKLAMGAALMLLGAAFVEAFWSSSGFPSFIKYSVAAALWILVIAYFTFAGRGHYGSR